MNSTGRYLPFNLLVDDGKVSLYQKHKDEDTVITHDVGALHVCSTDSADYKCLDQRHFGMMMMLKKSHRKLYFMSYQRMMEAIDAIISAQNFQSRIRQYAFLKELGTSYVSRRHLVRHRLTKELFEIKAIAKQTTLQENMKMFQTEALVLQKLASFKRVLQIVDYFEDETGIYQVT